MSRREVTSENQFLDVTQLFDVVKAIQCPGNIFYVIQDEAVSPLSIY
jgi:hypothetical protein